MELLPIHIQLKIIRYLDFESLLMFEAVCKSWKAIINWAYENEFCENLKLKKLEINGVTSRWSSPNLIKFSGEYAKLSRPHRAYYFYWRPFEPSFGQRHILGRMEINVLRVINLSAEQTKNLLQHLRPEKGIETLEDITFEKCDLSKTTGKMMSDFIEVFQQNLSRLKITFCYGLKDEHLIGIGNWVKLERLILAPPVRLIKSWEKLDLSREFLTRLCLTMPSLKWLSLTSVPKFDSHLLSCTILYTLLSNHQRTAAQISVNNTIITTADFHRLERMHPWITVDINEFHLISISSKEHGSIVRAFLNEKFGTFSIVM